MRGHSRCVEGCNGMSWKCTLAIYSSLGQLSRRVYAGPNSSNVYYTRAAHVCQGYGPMGIDFEQA
jgi:hypothetical protein